MRKKRGEFDFSFLDDAIEILAEYGIKTILGTPTAAPPKWLADKYDIVQRDKYGRKRIGVQDVKAAETIRAT